VGFFCLHLFGRWVHFFIFSLGGWFFFILVVPLVFCTVFNSFFFFLWFFWPSPCGFLGGVSRGVFFFVRVTVIYGVCWFFVLSGVGFLGGFGFWSNASLLLGFLFRPL